MASIKIIAAFVLSALLTTNAWSQDCEPMFEDASFGVGTYCVSGNLVLMTRPMIGIDVFDASDPNDFVFLSQVPFLGAIDLEIASAGDIAGVKISEGAIQLVDLSDPSNPVMGAIVTNPFGLISSFGIYNSTLYTNRNGFVRAYSLADIQNPVEVASANSNIQAKGLAIGDGVLITKSTNGGGTVYVFDLSNPNTLTLSAQVSGTLPSLYGSELAVIDGGLIRLYDLQNPSSPVELGSFSHGHNNGFSSIEGLALIGDLVAILSDEDMAY
jgi:LVIVD repeat